MHLGVTVTCFVCLRMLTASSICFMQLEQAMTMIFLYQSSQAPQACSVTFIHGFQYWCFFGVIFGANPGTAFKPHCISTT